MKSPFPQPDIQNMWKSTEISKRYFTLLEVCLAVAILGIVASLVGFQLKKMVDDYHFRKHIDLFSTELKKCQLLALSRHLDLTFTIKKNEDGQWGYIWTCDEPTFLRQKDRFIVLTGVEELKVDRAPAQKISLSVFHTGRIEPQARLELGRANGRGASCDLRTPLQIKCSYIQGGNDEDF